MPELRGKKGQNRGKGERRRDGSCGNRSFRQGNGRGGLRECIYGSEDLREGDCITENTPKRRQPEDIQDNSGDKVKPRVIE